MFSRAKNIDTAFRQMRLIAILVVIGCFLVSAFAVYKSFYLVSTMQGKIYVLANSKALEAYASDRKDNIPVEARDHVKTFHQLFFTLDPDDKLIQANLGKALYLADHSAKREYDNLKEKNYFVNIISGNVSQRITVDSVVVSTDAHPYGFRCMAKLEIIRASSIVRRNLVTEGELRNVSRSDNNPHGFLIERWRTIENKDIDIKSRLR